MHTTAYWSDGAAGPFLHDVIAALADPLGEMGWMDFALCQEVDPDLFFQEKGGDTRPAKRVCMACEVRAQCLDYALGSDKDAGLWEGLKGIWGGKTERERRAIRRQREQEAA
jgi:WhiB family transcriptional regulator, redox-sensing transcriptional regulator